MASPAFDQAQQLASAQDEDDSTNWDSVNLGGKEDIEAGMDNDSAPLLTDNNGAAPPPSAPAPAGAQPAQQPQSTPMCACLTITYYRPHFDVDTTDVVARLKKGLIPSRGENSLLAEVQQKPDLYGPFWVCTTLIFVIGASANFASWVYWDENTSWVYDFTLVTAAMAVAYGYVVGVPAVIWLGMKYLGVPISLTTLWCLYGYSMVPFIPAAMLCTTPWEIMDWAALAAAFGLSIAVLLRNVWTLIEQHAQPQQTKVSAGVMVFCHLVLAFMLKLSFFAHNTKP